MVLVFSYARTSVDDGMKISVEAQHEAIDRKVRSQGLKEPVRFSDKGISGATDNRPLFNKLKQAIVDSNEAGALYIWRYDRIARNTKHLLEFLDFCEAHRIQVFSLMEPLPEGVSFSHATQKMYLQVLGILGEMQRNVTIENINSTLAYKKQQKQYLGSTVPIGYLLIDGKVRQDKKYANLVRRIFELYVTENYGYKKIQTQLIQEGFTDTNHSLTVHRIQAILTNSLYCGVVKGGKLGSYRGDFQPIISEELFQQAQRIKKQRQSVKKDGRTYPLRKKIICPTCQWRLSPKRVNASPTNHFYHYYHCANRQCEGIMVSADKIEHEVLSQLRLFLENKEVFEELTKEVKEKLKHNQHMTQQKLVSTEKERKKIMQKYEANQLSLDELKQKLNQLDQIKLQSNDYRIPENELLNRLNQLLKMQQESVREVLWNQIRKVTIFSNKDLKEIYLTNLTENILQINKEKEHD